MRSFTAAVRRTENETVGRGEKTHCLQVWNEETIKQRERDKVRTNRRLGGGFCGRVTSPMTGHKQEREGAPLPSLHHSGQEGTCSLGSPGRTHCSPSIVSLSAAGVPSCHFTSSKTTGGGSARLCRNLELPKNTETLTPAFQEASL